MPECKVQGSAPEICASNSCEHTVWAEAETIKVQAGLWGVSFIKSKCEINKSCIQIESPHSWKKIGEKAHNGVAVAQRVKQVGLW